MRWLEPLIAALARVPDPLDGAFPTGDPSPGATSTASAPKRAPGHPLSFTGVPGAPGAVAGTVRVVRSVADAKSVLPGDIVIARWLGPTYAPLFTHAGGIVVERGGARSRGTALAWQHGIPMVVGVREATLLLRSGDEVLVDGSAGRVRVLRAAGAS